MKKRGHGNQKGLDPAADDFEPFQQSIRFRRDVHDRWQRFVADAKINKNILLNNLLSSALEKEGF